MEEEFIKILEQVLIFFGAPLFIIGFIICEYFIVKKGMFILLPDVKETTSCESMVDFSISNII